MEMVLMPPLPGRVIVTGDLTIDWGLEETAKQQSREHEDRLQTKITPRWMGSGAFLLAKMIEAAIEQRYEPMPDTVFVDPPDPPEKEELRAYENPYEHSFAVLARYGKTDQGIGKKKLRIRESLGFGGAIASQQHRFKPQPRDEDHQLSVIAIDDAGFRFRSNKDYWPEELFAQTTARSPWVILKVSRRIAEGDLWQYVMDRVRDERDQFADRLIIVTTADCLREAGAGIYHDLSWERCVQDVSRET